MKRTIRVSMAVAVAALLLASCGDAPSILRVLWQPDGEGYIQFRTNDSADYDQYFYHMPLVAGNDLNSTAGWTATAEVKQLAGTIIGYYGLIVGLDESNYVGVFIAENKYYSTVSRLAGGAPALAGWHELTSIQGPGVDNTLSASVPAGGSLITFTVNGTTVGTSALQGATMHAGFANTILTKAYEGFPRYYSDRRFKLTAPITYPTP